MISIGHAPKDEQNRLNNNEWTNGFTLMFGMLWLGIWQGF
jgi:hypothetical protein